MIDSLPMRIVFRYAMATALLASAVEAVLADDPAADARKRMVERPGGGIGFVTPARKQQKVTTIYITAISQLREWTSSDGRKMQGRLLAYSAPKPGETGQVVVIKEGKIKLLRSGTKKPADLLLSKLSKEDQDFVRQIAEKAAKGPPQAASPENEKPQAPK